AQHGLTLAVVAARVARLEQRGGARRRETSESLAEQRDTAELVHAPAVDPPTHAALLEPSRLARAESDRGLAEVPSRRRENEKDPFVVERGIERPDFARRFGEPRPDRDARGDQFLERYKARIHGSVVWVRADAFERWYGRSMELRTALEGLGPDFE